MEDVKCPTCLNEGRDNSALVSTKIHRSMGRGNYMGEDNEVHSHVGEHKVTTWECNHGHTWSEESLPEECPVPRCPWPKPGKTAKPKRRLLKVEADDFEQIQ